MNRIGFNPIAQNIKGFWKYCENTVNFMENKTNYNILITKFLFSLCVMKSKIPRNSFILQNRKRKEHLYMQKIALKLTKRLIEIILKKIHGQITIIFKYCWTITCCGQMHLTNTKQRFTQKHGSLTLESLKNTVPLKVNWRWKHHLPPLCWNS